VYVCIRLFACLLITQEREKSLSSNFQGSCRVPWGYFGASARSAKAGMVHSVRE